MIDHCLLARELCEAQRTVSPVQLLTDRHPCLTWADAREIATETDAIRLASGEQQIGWKLGWTSVAMRTALGIDRPNWGTLWAEQVCDEALSLAGFIHPKVEPELVWKSPVALSEPLTASEVLELNGEWALGIEVVDPRFPSFDFDALDNTADNSSSAAIRVGEFSPLAVDPANIELGFDDSTDYRTGVGASAMGSPAEAISWLVRSLLSEGLSLRAGDIVFTGGLTAPFDAEAGTTYSVRATDLATTTLRFDGG